MKIITLSNSLKYVALVDDDIYEFLKQYSWVLGNHGYAVHNTMYEGKKHSVLMHHIIMKREEGFYVDHVNRIRLDNRKENLRVVTAKQNAANQGGRKINWLGKTSTSKYKGVHWDKIREKWCSRILFENKRKNLGRYESEKEAALAYNNFIMENIPEYGFLNVISD